MFANRAFGESSQGALATGAPLLSRKCACGSAAGAFSNHCEECAGTSLQRKASGSAQAGAQAPAIVGDVLAGAGRPLETATRVDMESRFGHDFSGVRVHDDSRAAESARAVDAHAYTVARNIVFGAGRYAPRTNEGRKLLAHELAHVVQQRGVARPTAQPKLAGPRDDRGLEGDADRMAESALAGRAVSRPTAAPALIQRSPADPQSAPANAQTSQPASAPAAAPATKADPCKGATTSVKQADLGSGGGHRFDAELNRTGCPNCNLVVTMRVAFKFLDTVNPWPDQAAKDRFRDGFIEHAQQKWSNEYLLQRKGDCASEPCQLVRVAVVVVPVAVNANPHYVINVVNTNKSITSSVDRGTRQANLDSLDLGHADNPNQIPAEHEFGHMLGMGHTNCGLQGGPYNAGDKNDKDCYGQSDIMGMGSTITVDEYQVFRDTLNSLSPGCTWEFAITPERLASNRTTGAVTGGILGGLVGGAGGAALGGLIGSVFGPIGTIVGAIIGGIAGAIGGAIGGVKAGRAIGNAYRRSGEV